MVRFKNRYILCELVFADGQSAPHGSTPLTDGVVFRCVRDAVIRSHGDYGIGVLQLSLSVRYINPHTNMVLTRARRGAHQLVQAALVFVTQIRAVDASFVF
jgi:ribonuclease P/MRP protein subunit POP5